MKRARTLLSLAVLAAAVSFTTPLQAGDWPQFRGPDRTDVSKEKGLLKKWPAGGPKKAWMFRDAGIGYSGPAIANGMIYLMGGFDDGEYLIALNEATGKRMWKTRIGEVYDNNWGDGPRATPTVSGGGVYAMGAKGDLLCVNAKTGKKIWSKSMTEDLGGGVPGWGYCESVLVDGDVVICSPGGKNGAIAALNRRTGDLIWQSKEVTDGAQYSSVVPATINGQKQYVQLFMKSLVGVAAKDGKLLWKTDWPGRTAVIPTPIVSGNVVYIASGYGVGCKAVRIGPGNSVTELYQNKVMKNHHGGVILYEGHLYGYSDGRGWTCQNFETGEEVWSNNDDLKKGAIACADGMLYCLGEGDGTVVLIEASPKGWKERGRFKLDPQTTLRKPSGKIWTHPVIANGKLYLRDQDLFFCFDIRG